MIKFLVCFMVFYSCVVYAKGFEKCDIPDKWILSIVKATGGSSVDANDIPDKVLHNINPECMDDITDAIFKDKLDYPKIVDVVRKVQGSKRPKGKV